MSENMQPEEFDLVILGSGVGTKVAAWTFGGKGQRVAVIERKYVGGACPNIACLPSKNIIHSAKVASYVRSGQDFGITTHGFSVDMSGVRARKRAMVSDLLDVHLANFRKSGSDLIMGSGRFIGPRTLEVALNDGSTRRLRGKNVIIGTGSRAALDSTPGLAEAQPLTHVEALELDQLPQHLIVIGGGYVGLEFAQAMRRFGSRVTVLEHTDRLIHQEDDDVTDAVHKLFEGEGIQVLVNARVKRVSGKSGESVRVVIEQDGAEKTLEASHLLAASGRLPNTEGLGVDLAGIELTHHGYIKVNERLETTAPHVWAVGDVNGGPKFTHVSYDDFRVVHDNINGGNHVTTGRLIPFSLFTDPELARVGLSEKEARAQRIPYRLFKMPAAEILRTHTLGEMQGFLKALVERDGERILGFTAFAPNGGEIMSAMELAMVAGLPYTKLPDVIFAHPTMMEGLNFLFSFEVTAPASAGAAR